MLGKSKACSVVAPAISWGRAATGYNINNKGRFSKRNGLNTWKGSQCYGT